MTYRTHNCGELRPDHTGQIVTLAGWVQRKRQLGGLLFLDLRDHYGVTQIVARPGEILDHLSEIGLESVISVQGEVLTRAPHTVNDNIATGQIELLAVVVETLSAVENLPIPVAVKSETGEARTPEELRLKHRYLDLRGQRLHNNIVLRSNVISSLRQQMTDQGFLEIQTPILTASSPEGARDYLVPSRLHPGKFYALPQAPQMFKQLLMVAGFDRYFQIAPCFRDEAGRSDRSPGEFYQLDFEMSFVDQDAVFAAIEPVLHRVFETYGNGRKVSPYPFPRLTYRDSILKYGSDKPDLRNPLVIEDVTVHFVGTGLAAQPSESIYAIMVDAVSRSVSERLISETSVRYTKIEGRSAFFVKSASGDEVSLKQLGIVRDRLGSELDLIERDVFRFCWIVDFPMYERDPQTGKIDFSHNPFSMPQGELEALNTKDPLDILAYQYDIVCNGVELSSGAIRNHKPEIMYRAFEIAGYSPEQVDKNFSGMIEAFKCGAPPHGGSAPGIDRIVMLLADEPNLREVVAFPMNQQAEDLMMGAPSFVSDKQLTELGLPRIIDIGE